MKTPYVQFWPDDYDFTTDPVCQNVFKPFIERHIQALEDYDAQRPDGHTYIFHEHATRVAENVRRTCLHMGLVVRVANNMYWAVMPHDIGKKNLPVEIWDQEEKPDVRMKTYRRTHTLLGAQIVEEELHNIDHPFKDLMMDLMRYHHEQMDGNGTLGVAGADLPLPVRLCAIVEAYDGWRIWRPHYGDRDISPPGVLARMRDEKGAEVFDMDLFEAFADMKMNDFKNNRLLQN
ncbi:MAG: HD-GYP domain-containing protein [Bdellovibrionales bacterium]